MAARVAPKVTARRPHPDLSQGPADLQSAMGSGQMVAGSAACTWLSGQMVAGGSVIVKAGQCSVVMGMHYFMGGRLPVSFMGCVSEGAPHTGMCEANGLGLVCQNAQQPL